MFNVAPGGGGLGETCLPSSRQDHFLFFGRITKFSRGPSFQVKLASNVGKRAFSGVKKGMA